MKITPFFNLWIMLVTALASVVAVPSLATDVDDKIKLLTVTEFVGTEQSPRVDFDVDVKKVRDVYIVLKHFDSWKNIKDQRVRIKKSGKYHLTLDTSELTPGKYRVTAYMTPRGKDWTARIGGEPSAVFTVVDTPKYVREIAFAEDDVIQQVQWPKKVANESNTLLVHYAISQPRGIVVKLFSQQTKQAVTTIEYPVGEPGEWRLPISGLADKIPAGDYVWVVYLAESGKQDAISNKYRMPFTLSKD